jgi:hypothetical protein
MCFGHGTGELNLSAVRHLQPAVTSPPLLPALRVCNAVSGSAPHYLSAAVQSQVMARVQDLRRSLDTLVGDMAEGVSCSPGLRCADT